MKFKLVLYGNNMYKEIVLDDTFTGGLTIGTEKSCQVGFRRERFLSDFVVRIDRQEDGNFVISCSESIYLKKEAGVKEYIRYLSIGDNIALCYEYTDTEFFYIDFFVQFESVGTDFDMKLDCRGCTELTIGGNTSDTIRVDSVNLLNDSVTVRKVFEGYEVDSSNTRYGVEINGFISREAVSFIANGEFFSVGGYNFCVKDDFIYTTKKAAIITNLKQEIIAHQKNHFEYPEFKKNVRQRYKMPDGEIEILDPKAKEEKEEQSFMMTLMPMLVNMLLMVGLRGIMGGGGMFVIYFAATMSMTTIMTIVSHFADKKKQREKEEKREEKYLEYLSKREDEIIKSREKERVIANQMSPTLDEYVKFVSDFDNRLFEKEKEHDDYLAVRMGDGIVESTCPVTYKQEDYVETEDTLKEYPKALHDKYQYISDMPIMLDLNSTNAVGFIGSRTKLYQMAKNLIVEFAASHYYKDVKLFLVMDECDVEMFEWARWMQIFYNDNTNTRNFMYDEDSAKFALEFLYSELSRRESAGKAVKELQDYVVLVYRSELVNNHPVSKYISKAKELGFRFVFFEEYEELVNSACEKRIFLNTESNKGYVQDVEDGVNIQEFKYGHISKKQAEEAAKKLSCVYVDEINLENSLTKNITLFELLNIMTPYDLDLKSRWANSKIYKSMAAPLGVKSGDEVVCLDLHEKYHGPHGLVAGTTGSGKSEIMQSYILSMATLFHPHEVGFIIIDFKGGGMVNQFRNLPHLNGAITNIDGNEIERSLLSIKAELIKRQEKFAEHNVNHIDDYIKLYKEGQAKLPLPHLILIVDEFAELKSEQPEFMKELISAARIGRSLGVHLILATQKPSGVVSDQIWSNSKFKLCLKVQNKNDSNEVLKSPLAAEIREPGRAYLQVGNNEIFQLFQSAYSGASAKNDDIGAQKKFMITKVELSGKKSIIYEQKPDDSKGGETQLEAIVNYVREYCDNAKIPKVPDICLPSLSTEIPFTLEGDTYNGTDIVIPVGIVDDPSRQRQYVETINISQNNIYILGSSQSGKTNLIQTMIRGLATKYSPKEVNIFILDFASMILKNFNDLNHVGGVVTSSEDEKLKTFLRMLNQEIQKRKNILAKQGLSSYSSYRESGQTDLPQILVILDNWVSFRSYFPDYEEMIISITRECVSLGISFVVTAQQTAGAGFKLMSNFSKRIALYCNDSGSYSFLFESCRKKLADIPGRGIVEKEKVYYECQHYLAFAAEKEFEKIKLMKEFIAEIAAKYPDEGVRGIPEIPERVSEQFIKKQYGKDCVKPYEVLMGLDFDTISLRKFNMLKTPLFGFLGRKESNKSEYVKYMLNTLMSNHEQAPVSLFVIDDIEGSLGMFKDKTVMYSNTQEDMMSAFAQIHATLTDRYARYQKRQINMAEEPLLLLVINSADLLKAASADKTKAEMYKDIIGKYKDLKVSILCTDLENAAIIFTAGELLKTLKDSKLVMAFEDIKTLKFIEISAMVAREYKKPIEYSDAYVFNGDKIEKIRSIQG